VFNLKLVPLQGLLVYLGVVDPDSLSEELLVGEVHAKLILPIKQAGRSGFVVSAVVMADGRKPWP
jgi:hypothetical protein